MHHYLGFCLLCSRLFVVSCIRTEFDNYNTNNFGLQVIRQMATTLTNRLVVFVRGILFGQIQNKTLRLSATNARDETASTLMDTDVGAFVDGIPDILELVAGAIEIGAVISYMSGHWGAVSFTAIIPALCKFNYLQQLRPITI